MTDSISRLQALGQPEAVRKLSLCHFVEHGENLMLLGPHWVDGTHLAVALGLKAI